MHALALLALELPLHRLDRVQDQIAVDDAEHRTAETEKGSVAAAEDALRGGVVEQDPALAVADENALVQLGDSAASRLRSASTRALASATVTATSAASAARTSASSFTAPASSRSSDAPDGATRCEGFPCAIRRTSSARRRALLAVAANRR